MRHWSGPYFRIFLSAVALLLSPCLAFAGSFEVAPTTVMLPAETGATVIHLTNRGKETVFAQIEALDWTQPAMRDKLEPSDALQVSPPMVHLVPGQQQTIRLLALPDSTARKEHAFRLSISELPDPATKKNGIQVLLQFMVPVFTEIQEKSAPMLAWKAESANDGIVLTAVNNGVKHLKLSELAVYDANGKQIASSGKAFNYLLPGAAHQWKIAAAAKLIAGQQLSISVKDEGTGTIKGSYVVEK